MKIGLIGINSQFVHSNLALYYMREEIDGRWENEIREYNNNEPILNIFYDLMARHYDVIAFSVYLWNKETVIKLTQLLHSAEPTLKIILGGPEPTYAPEDFQFAGYIVSGAAEPTWLPLLDCLEQGKDPSLLPGVNGKVQFADSWKFPYHESDLPRLKNRLVYYETSRGCPYQCAFCLSSAEKHTAFLPLERVEKELAFFLEHEIPVVKLVDRTFNAPKERGKAILRYLLAHYKPGITFHFELKGELLDDETVELLISAPPGFFQVEIGVQSLNPSALKESHRQNQWQKTKAHYKKLIEAENVHTHFDLIAALPHEDMASFRSGFNEVMTIAPHYLQVGFLKLLPGTKLEREREEHGYIAEAFPPYEVVKSKTMSVAELAELKQLDHFMDTVYNKGIRRQTLHYALKKNGPDTFSLFLQLAAAADPLEALEQYLPEVKGAWAALMRLDDFLSGSGGKVSAEEEREINRLVQDRDFIAAYLPHYREEAPREIYKRTRILLLPVKILFDEKGLVSAVSEGSTKLLLDLHKKGRQKRGKGRPSFSVLS